MSWLPDDFVHPVHVPVPSTALHLRPIREADTPIDYPAVMGSRERLYAMFGPAWGWPAETMTYDEDRIDLLRHEKEIAAHQSFNYALLNEDETELLGCVYVDPPERTGADAEISWWVVDVLVDSVQERALDALVPQWIAADWPFRRPRYIGRDLTWQEWLALPPLDRP
ncbi:N-acetyltransferase [Streptomyces sp. NPDC046939]|uniref:N-acetyltransferase n=1 Tax=Streptomyces sp. NPDC046939 TaxID=3155376 RepID=UPI0033FABA61